jgi:hypothetical protein
MSCCLSPTPFYESTPSTSSATVSYTHARAHTVRDTRRSLVVQSCAAPLSPTPTIHVHSRRYIAEPDTWAPPPRSPRLACVIPQPSCCHAGAVAEHRDNAVSDSFAPGSLGLLLVCGGWLPCPAAPTTVAIKRSALVLVGDLPAAVASWLAALLVCRCMLLLLAPLSPTGSVVPCTGCTICG